MQFLLFCVFSILCVYVRGSEVQAWYQPWECDQKPQTLMGSGLSNWRGLGSGGWLLYKLVQDQLRKRPVMCVYLFYQWLLISIRQRGGTGYYCLCFLHECWLCVYWKRLCLLVISGWLATWACVCTCVCILVPMRNVYSSDSLG